MKGTFWVSAALLAAVSVGAVGLGFGLAPERSAPAASGALAVDRPGPAPEISFSDAVGNSLTLTDFRGKVVLLNLWATWCAPCVEEMPSLDRLQARLGGEDFQVLALSLDRGGMEVVQRFYEANGLGSLDIYLDRGGRSPMDMKVPGLPASFVIDRDGRIVGRVLGAHDWDSDASIAALRRYIGT